MKNVCVVGYGAIGPAHAMALENLDNAKLYAVCDIDDKRLEEAKEQYQDIVLYENFDDMLEDENIHSVHICTPHYLHFYMIKKALMAGKSVVCEKPTVMTKKEFDELLTLDGAENVCAIFQNRINPCVVKMKEIADSKELGDVVAAKGMLTWNKTPEYYNSGDWRGKWDTEGGGVLINQAIHTFDYFSFVLGGIKSLKANMTNFTLGDVIEVEDTFTASIKLKNDAKCVFFASNAYGTTLAPEFEIVFEKGVVRYISGMLYVNGEFVTKDSEEFIGKAYWGIGHKGLFKDYYDLGKHYSPFDVKDTMNAVFAMYESAKSGGKEIIL